MKRLIVLLFPLPMLAHMVSMSTGELRVDGASARYELKMPLYEIAHVPDPERTLLDHIRFSSAGVEGRLTSRACETETATYVCAATYNFPAPVDQIDVECGYPSITVPNHVHVLRAYNHGNSDQAVFDVSYASATLLFHPPTALESALRGMAGGMMRAAGGIAPLLFLLSLTLGARTRPELVAMAAAFLAGQIVACLMTPHIAWTLSPRFIEAAAALSIAYLAFEIVLLPQAGKRWVVAGALGLFQGAYFSMFLRESESGALWFLVGAVAAESLLLLALALTRWRLLRRVTLPTAVPIAASALFAVGMCWFFLRLKS